MEILRTKPQDTGSLFPNFTQNQTLSPWTFNTTRAVTQVTIAIEQDHCLHDSKFGTLDLKRERVNASNLDKDKVLH